MTFCHWLTLQANLCFFKIASKLFYPKSHCCVGQMGKNRRFKKFVAFWLLQKLSSCGYAFYRLVATCLDYSC